MSASCQFCGRDVSKVYRHVEDEEVASYKAPTLNGVNWAWYTVIAAFWILDGAFNLAAGVGVISLGMSGIAVAVGAVVGVIGAGFLMRSPVFRNHYMSLCFIVLCTGVATTIEGTKLSAQFATAGYVLCLAGAVRALSAGLMAKLAARTVSKYAR